MDYILKRQVGQDEAVFRGMVFKPEGYFVQNRSMESDTQQMNKTFTTLDYWTSNYFYFWIRIAEAHSNGTP